MLRHIHLIQKRKKMKLSALYLLVRGMSERTLTSKSEFTVCHKIFALGINHYRNHKYKDFFRKVISAAGKYLDPFRDILLNNHEKLCRGGGTMTVTASFHKGN